MFDILMASLPLLFSFSHFSSCTLFSIGHLVVPVRFYDSHLSLPFSASLFSLFACLHGYSPVICLILHCGRVVKELCNEESQL